MKSLLLHIFILALLSTFATAHDKAKKTIDIVFIVPNGFQGPIFVNQGRLAMSDVTERQKNTYTVTIVDEDGEAFQVGDYDLIPGCIYKYTVVQRNGLPIKTEDDGDQNEVALRVIGGYGAGNRAYRPGPFGLYFIGTKDGAEDFRGMLESLINMPKPDRGEQEGTDDLTTRPGLKSGRNNQKQGEEPEGGSH